MPVACAGPRYRRYAQASFVSGADVNVMNAGLVSPQPLMKASRSGLITSAWVVSMPCG